MIQNNIAAPLFNLNDIYNRSIDLKSFKGKKVFIGFFRHAGCPFCNLRVHALTKVHQELKAQGMEMIFFFESKANVILRSSFHQGVSPIPLIADPEKKWYEAYGLEPSALKSTLSHMTSFVQTAYQAYRKDLPIHLMSEDESFSTMPAEFLLDENLIVRKVHYAQRLNDRMNIDDLKSFTKEKITAASV
jgi:thioredoxin-dependent peroxiredoxin